MESEDQRLLYPASLSVGDISSTTSRPRKAAGATDISAFQADEGKGHKGAIGKGQLSLEEGGFLRGDTGSAVQSLLAGPQGAALGNGQVPI